MLINHIQLKNSSIHIVIAASMSLYCGGDTSRHVISVEHTLEGFHNYYYDSFGGKLHMILESLKFIMDDFFVIHNTHFVVNRKLQV